MALSIACVHVPYLATGDKLYSFGATGALLPMFFALSGFLVAGSLDRCRTVLAFVGLRIIRIVPALAVETVLSALIVGPLLTSVSLAAYFSDPRFARYFLNIAGDIHFYLPGVFDGAPGDKAVNGQLWSVPYELLCYIALTGLALLGVRRWRVLALAITAGSFAIYPVMQGLRHGLAASTYLPSGLILVWCFLIGVCFYLYRGSIPWSRTLLLASVAGGAVALSMQGWFMYLAPVSLTYLTVYLGLTNCERITLVKGADYSYGVYLYHWVIQQSVMDVMPRHWLVNAVVSLPLTVGFAAASWHLVEGPMLRLRTPLMRMDRQMFSAREGASA